MTSVTTLVYALCLLGSTFAVVGDSHVEWPLSRALRGELASRGAVLVLSDARRGWGIATFLSGRAATLAVVRGSSADVIVVVVGTNDIGISSDVLTARYDELVLVMGDHRWFLVGPPEFRDDVGSDVADVQRAAVGPSFIDGALTAPRWPVGRAGDGVHLTITGGATWARNIVDEIIDSMCGRRSITVR